jgi:hypothetical protein
MSKLTFIKSILSGKVNLSAFLKYLQKTNNLGLAANFSKLVSVSNHLSKDFGINFDTDFNELIQDIERLDALLSLEKRHRYEIGGGQSLT